MTQFLTFNNLKVTDWYVTSRTVIFLIDLFRADSLILDKKYLIRKTKYTSKILFKNFPSLYKLYL